MTLKLEYQCTEADLQEAKSLHLRQHYGGGSKWKTQVVLFAMLAVTVTLLYLEIKTEVSPPYRGWVLAFVAVGIVVLVILKRLKRKKTGQPIRLEASERELIFNHGSGRVAIPWPSFSRCVESPNLFVLLDRPKVLLYAVPKRAFPDDGAQEWFRTQAKQPSSVAPASDHDEPPVPGRFVSANGIALTVQLKYRDYLSRNFSSWRMRGIIIAIFALATVISLVTPAPPDAVNPPAKVFLIMVSVLAPILAVVILFACFVSWRGEKKYLGPEQIVLTNEGIEFVGSDSSGRVAWSTYKHYHENRWSFFVWNPRGMQWLMIPKREFVSRSDVEQCRELLRTNLKRSRWFFM